MADDGDDIDEPETEETEELEEAEVDIPPDWPDFDDNVSQRALAVMLLVVNCAKVQDQDFRKAALEMVGVVTRSIKADAKASVTAMK